MLNKKFEFDLNVADPKVTLENLIERAGYHKFFTFTNQAGYDTVMTEEMANTKLDIFNFIEKINQVSGLKLELVDGELIEEDNEVHFHTRDGKFGGIIIFPGLSNGRTASTDDTRFQLSYSEDGEIFN